MCRQLHQMLPCMKSQLVVIDKFPNTSKDFSNYLSPLLKLNSCISFPTPHFFFFSLHKYVRACLRDSATASRKIRPRKTERARGGGVEKHGEGMCEEEEERRKGGRGKRRECVGLESWTRRRTASVFISSLSGDGQSFIIREAVSGTYF